MTKFEDLLAPFARKSLAHLPTPLHHLERISAVLGGPKIYIKRDDCTGLAGGGNKTRKLEFLMADAIAKGADCVITTGGMQSNHCRQTAAAAARLGLECRLALIDKVDWQEPAYRCAGNVTLDHVLGAKVFVFDAKAERDVDCAKMVEDANAEGKTPYFIPLGGSNAIGALGYVAAFGEMLTQLDEMNVSPSALYHCTSSGGTHAGLIAGALASEQPIPIKGVENEGEPIEIGKTVGKIVEETLALLGLGPKFDRNLLSIRTGVGGPSYGIPNDDGNAAIKLMAAQEGILLDPVYTGKAFAGLVADIKEGKYARDESVVFLHTGGAQALGAYSSLFVK